MSDKMNKNKNNTTKQATEGKGLDKNNKNANIFQEEQIVSPWKTVVKQFASNKLSMISFITFLAIFLFMFIAPYFFKMDLGYNEPMQADLPPAGNYMKFPEAMKTGARDVSVGSTFGVGIDK
ncbi:MAG: hypothetical protein GX833_05515, partial [Clostridium sp.]|nr:hypothetical protein [Clostridium sp.]